MPTPSIPAVATIHPANHSTNLHALMSEMLQPVTYGEARSKTEIAATISKIALTIGLSAFGAWVFVTPAKKAIELSPRMQDYIARLPDFWKNQFIPNLSAVSSFVSNLGVNTFCIYSCLTRQLDWLASSNTQHTHLSALQYYDKSTWETVLNSLGQLIKTIWGFSAIIPFFLLSRDDELVKTASDFAKYLYATVISGSLLYVFFEGIYQYQKAIAHEWYITYILHPEDTRTRDLKSFRYAQSSYFKENITKLENAGIETFDFTLALLALTRINDPKVLAHTWHDLISKNPQLKHKHFDSIREAIDALLVVDLDQATRRKGQLQLFFNVMYSIEQIIDDKYALKNGAAMNDTRLSVVEQKCAVESIKAATWKNTLLDLGYGLLNAVAKLMFAIYTAEYLLSVMGFGLDAGYRSAESVAENWKSTVFALVNILSNAAIMGLCLPSLQVGWEVSCDLLIYYPMYAIHSALSQVLPQVGSAKFQGYANASLESHLSGFATRLAALFTIAVCMWSGGPNAYVNETTIPRWLTSLGFSQGISSFFDINLWWAAIISSAMMNSYYAVEVTSNLVSKFVNRVSTQRNLLHKKEKLREFSDQLNTLSPDATAHTMEYLQEDHVKLLVKSNKIDAYKMHGLFTHKMANPKSVNAPQGKILNWLEDDIRVSPSMAAGAA